MIESHLNEGRQDMMPVTPLQHGVSVTDATMPVLQGVVEAVRARRKAVLINAQQPVQSAQLIVCSVEPNQTEALTLAGFALRVCMRENCYKTEM